MTVTSNTQKISASGNGTLTVFAYNFKIFAAADLLVILRSATGTETTQNLASNYTVSGVGAASGGNVTMGVAPASGTTLVIQRVQPRLQGLDLVPNDPFPAQSMEDALDKLVFNVQGLHEEVGRSIKASTTNVIGNTEFTISATDRANKLFSFDSSGNLNIAQELGIYRGNWAANTAYAVRDLVKDTSTGNIFICITAHTSSGSQPITTNTDAAKWALLVDAASATTSKNAAAASATASANSATASSNSATNSGNSATTSGNSATASGNSATASGNSATSSGNSATASASSATSAAASLTTFTRQYHGAASSDPTANLTVGDLYFKTGSGMRVYNGSAWVAAAFDVSGALINTNNLSDVSSAATALANLGVSSTAAELNLLDGVTGLVKADLTKLAAINSTAAELNELDAITRGSILYGNASGATARLAKGSAATVLTSDGTDISWAAAGGGVEVTFPSNWASPTTTYTSSGTWSKGSLADDAYVWLYLIGGGGGGSMRESASSTGVATGGNGGGAFFIYGKAGVLNGTVFTIGAAVTGRTAAMGGTRHLPVTGNVSSFQMPASTGGLLHVTKTSQQNSTPSSVKIITSGGSTDTLDLSGSLGDFTFDAVPDPFAVSDRGTPTGVYGIYGPGQGAYNMASVQVCVFGGGNGGALGGTSKAAGTSEFAGNGGANAAQGVAGTAPGGGGGGSTNNSNNGGAGAAGLLRQYNV